MSIWFQKNINPDDLYVIGKNTMTEFLNLKWEAPGEDFLRLSMEISDKTRQPYGFLHGGASCVLIETVGSVASALVIDREKYFCVGLEINANHLRSVSEGIVTVEARPLHLGRSTHVWDTKIYDEKEKLFCAGRLTVAVIPIKKG